MGLLSSIFGGGSSSSQANTSNADNRQVTATGGVSSQNGSGTTNIKLTTTDLGAVKGAFDFAGQQSAGAYNFALQSEQNSYSLAHDAVNGVLSASGNIVAANEASTQQTISAVTSQAAANTAALADAWANSKAGDTKTVQMTLYVVAAVAAFAFLAFAYDKKGK